MLHSALSSFQFQGVGEGIEKKHAKGFCEQVCDRCNFLHYFNHFGIDCGSSEVVRWATGDRPALKLPSADLTKRLSVSSQHQPNSSMLSAISGCQIDSEGPPTPQRPTANQLVFILYDERHLCACVVFGWSGVQERKVLPRGRPELSFVGGKSVAGSHWNHDRRRENTCKFLQ